MNQSLPNIFKPNNRGKVEIDFIISLMLIWFCYNFTWRHIIKLYENPGGKKWLLVWYQMADHYKVDIFKNHEDFVIYYIHAFWKLELLINSYTRTLLNIVFQEKYLTFTPIFKSKSKDKLTSLAKKGIRSW